MKPNAMANTVQSSGEYSDAYTGSGPSGEEEREESSEESQSGGRGATGVFKPLAGTRPTAAKSAPVARKSAVAGCTAKANAPPPRKLWGGGPQTPSAETARCCAQRQ